MDDFRIKVNGGIKTGIMLWESVVIPFLLHNASTWMEMRKTDLDKLTKLQNQFFFKSSQGSKLSFFDYDVGLGDNFDASCTKFPAPNTNQSECQDLNNPSLINQSEPQDSITHLFQCNAFSDISEGLDILDDGMLADFFIKVVQRRMENGED